jgi:acyl-CoA synthetase (AMP-forming)/AMP-acid ligase II
LKGSNITSGYWNNPELTKENFGIYLSDTGEGPFFRTGDLGFIQNDNLYITGREKDLIIINGKNHYPQDIEQTVFACNDALQPDGGAAAGLEINEKEELLIIQEVKKSALSFLDTASI